MYINSYEYIQGYRKRCCKVMMFFGEIQVLFCVMGLCFILPNICKIVLKRLFQGFVGFNEE